MNPQKGYYVKDRRFDRSQSSRRPRRRSRRSPQGPLLAITMLLVIVTIALAFYHFLPELLPGKSAGTTDKTSATGTNDSNNQNTENTAPDITPTPTIPPAANNPQLLPASELAVQSAGTPADGCSPSQKNLVSTIFDSKYNKLSSFKRENLISLLNPLFYNKIPGVLTFRGNNFRNAAAFGLVSLAEKTMTQVWSRPVGSLNSSSWSFSWTGTGWTGQPLLVQWDEDTRQLMNINADKKSKENLVEVIYATMDGNIYFYDLDDGKPTRDPIKVGATIKGTPCVDPRGYPILYVGQGDKNGTADGIGFRIYNLIDQSLLLFKNCSDSNSYRKEWGACDSSPIVDGQADTLIYPNENGMIYTVKLNTQFDPKAGKLSINPSFYTYRYKMDGLKNFGIESSISIYDKYGFYSDNSGILSCVNLNTLKPVWSRQLQDDSDVTPVLDQKGTSVAIYTGTEVDWQKSIVGVYQGKSYVYKVDAMTGKILWQTSYSCWTKNAANVGDDVNGGAMGTPIVGKKSMKDLVIFSFCMTNGVYSGNTLVAFNQSDGKVVWEYKMNNYSWSSPVDIYDEDGHGYIVVPDSIGQLHLIDGLTGKRLSVLQLTKNSGADKAGNIESSCAIFNNRLVIGTRGNVIIGVELK